MYSSNIDSSRVISDRMGLLSDLVSSLRTNIESIGVADDSLKEISVGIHGLSVLLSRNGREKSANERLEYTRAQLMHYDNLHSLLDYAHTGRFEDEATFIKNFMSAEAGIRYFSTFEKSAESQHYISKYGECIKSMMPKLIELIKRDCKQEDLFRYTKLFSNATFGFPEYDTCVSYGLFSFRFDSYLDDVLRVVYDRYKQLPQSEQMDLLKVALPLHFGDSHQK